MDDRRIDAHIDAAAKGLTEAAPPSDMRERVLARIASGEADRSAPLAVRLAPAAALVAAVVWTAVMWPERQPQRVTESHVGPAPSASGSAIAEAQTQREPDASLSTRFGAMPVQPPRSASAPAAARDISRPTTSELAPEPLMIAAMAPDTIAALEPSAIGPLEVDALSITSLEIEPIDSQAPAAMPSRGHGWPR